MSRAVLRAACALLVAFVALYLADGALAKRSGAKALGQVQVKRYYAVPLKDGKTEIVLAGWDKNIYVWDYDFPFQPNGSAPWPQFHHDARRTGFSGAPLYVGGVDDGPLAGGAVFQGTS